MDDDTNAEKKAIKKTAIIRKHRITMNPQITIIVPVYNGAPFLERCIDSILSQTIKDRMELIIINDGSTDNSGEIAEEYAKRNNCVRVIHQKNKGLPATRVVGIQESKGEWIGFVDADDFVDSQMYGKLLCKAEEEGADISGCDYYETDGTTNKTKPSPKSTEKTKLIRSILNGSIHGSLCRIIAKSEIYKSSRITYAVANMCEDLCVSIQIMHISNKIAWTHEPLYYYYKHPESITQHRTKEKDTSKCDQRTRNIDIVEDFCKKENIAEIFSDELVLQRYFCKRYLHPYMKDSNIYKKYISLPPKPTIKFLLRRNIAFRYKMGLLLSHLRIIHLFYK